MKKIYLLFTLFLLMAALPIRAEVGKGSISFTSQKAANAKIKLTIETGTAAETKLNETFSVSGAIVSNLKVINATADNAPYYDLQGRRIAKPTRSGLYIHNGKKIFIK